MAHAGSDLVNAVASVLTDTPATAKELRNRLVGTYTTRAVRYAITELIETGRAKRLYNRGPVVAMNKKNAEICF